jgi:hypothetical protein
MKAENIIRMIAIMNAVIYKNDKKTNKLLCELKGHFECRKDFLNFIFKFGRFTNNMMITGKSLSTINREKEIRNKWIDYFNSKEIQDLMKKTPGPQG